MSEGSDPSGFKRVQSFLTLVAAVWVWGAVLAVLNFLLMLWLGGEPIIRGVDKGSDVAVVLLLIGIGVMFQTWLPALGIAIFIQWKLKRARRHPR